MSIFYSPGVNPPQHPVLPEIPDDGSVHVIPLNRGLYALIDVLDKSLIDDWHFSARNNHNDPGQWQIIAGRGSLADGTRESSFLHTLITGWRVTDHKDGCVFNNLRSNLREATDAQNQYNQAIRNDNTSGFRGVCWHIRHKRWMAQIKVNGKRKHLGYFPCGDGTCNVQNTEFDYGVSGEYDMGLINATLAYDMAAREHHKDFATLNFPMVGERSAITGSIHYADPTLDPELAVSH
jgi:hypothetical protein